MYGGVGPTMLKGAINNCIRFSTFSEMKHLYEKTFLAGDGVVVAGGKEQEQEPQQRRRSINALESMFLGSISGGLSAVVTHPIDTIKSNMQSLGGGGYKNSIDCMMKIMARDGIKGLYRGLEVRIVRVCMEIGLQFTLYDIISKELDRML